MSPKCFLIFPHIPFNVSFSEIQQHLTQRKKDWQCVAEDLKQAFTKFHGVVKPKAKATKKKAGKRKTEDDPILDELSSFVAKLFVEFHVNVSVVHCFDFNLGKR